jgi:hypothetical protein
MLGVFATATCAVIVAGTAAAAGFRATTDVTARTTTFVATFGASAGAGRFAATMGPTDGAEDPYLLSCDACTKPRLARWETLLTIV